MCLFSSLSKGQLEMNQLKILRTKFPKISAYVVEPSNEMMTKYKDAIREDETDIGDIEFKWKEQTIKEYIELENKITKQMFNYISLFHSVYFLENLEEAIKTLYSLLRPRGIMLVLAITSKW